ncbi:MAG: CotH kinase family protein, partial [Candidatus Krumholzibacteria bacterium]|nr:CotH kinase family protein [Candidatus Krumholzibacteria bacterium]
MFSRQPGFYDAPISVSLTAGAPGAIITYTLDGSEPTLDSTVFTAPILLGDPSGNPNTISLIPTNFRTNHHFAWRPPRGPVCKLNLIRARAFVTGQEPSPVATGSFVVSADLAGQFPLPVVSVATAAENFFADDRGIYVPGDTYIPGDLWSGNYFQEGDDWERPVHIELFDGQGHLLLAQDAGARIHGYYTRHYPQKTLRLYARSEYGAARFQCALFDDLPYDSYKRFLIRNSGNDWGYIGFLDLAMQTMIKDMGFDTQAGRPVIHFINGEYWGLANLRERYDRHYIEQHYSVAADEIVILANNADLEEGVPEDQAEYLALRDYVIGNDMSQTDRLAYVSERIDLDNFIAYMTAEIFNANHDWPGNNIRYWRRRTAAFEPTAPYGHDGRWRWLAYDLDDCFYQPSRNTLAHATAINGPEWPNPPWSTALLRGLLVNEAFRYQFINTFADHLNSTFIPARLIRVIDDLAAQFAPAIAAFQDRWDITFPWVAGLSSLRSFAIYRPAHQRLHIVDQFQLAGTTNVTLNVNDPALGKIQLNSLVIDGALAGLADPAQPYPWNGIYFQGVPITVTALPQFGYRFLFWQETGSHDAQVTLSPGPAPISLTAVFEIDPTAPAVLHAWHFNDLPSGALTAVAADVSLFGGAVITYPGTGAGYLDR